MSKTHLFWFILLFTSLAHNSAANTTPLDRHPKIYKAYQAVLKLRMDSAKNILESIIPNQQQLSHYQYVSSLSNVIQILITEDEALYDKYEVKEDYYLKLLKDLDDEDPYKRLYIAGIKIQWALVKILFDENFKAGWSLKYAYGEIEKNIEEFPDFNLNYKVYGELHILFSVVPESYHWLLSLMGIKGNISLGWDELNSVAENNPYEVEIGIIKALIALNVINREEETMAIIKKLYKDHQDNLIIAYLYSVANIKYAKSEKALPVLKQMISIGKDFLPINFSYYRLGDIYLQKKEYFLARHNYSVFLNQHKGSNYVKDTWMKIFLSYWLEGNKKMSDIVWKEAENSGKAFVSADRNANDILSQDSYPNKSLMIARLAVDGGYFNIARRTLSGMKRNLLEDKMDECEYFYRYARLYDKTGNKEDAVFHYLNTIKKNGKKNSWYFGPSSCLRIGYIYEEREEYDKAEYYFNKAKSYKKHKYKDGIDNMANASLQLLQKKLLSKGANAD